MDETRTMIVGIVGMFMVVAIAMAPLDIESYFQASSETSHNQEIRECNDYEILHNIDQDSNPLHFSYMVYTKSVDFYGPSLGNKVTMSPGEDLDISLGEGRGFNLKLESLESRNARFLLTEFGYDSSYQCWFIAKNM
jgi:hypothetical protein